jgi:hypothetical protein
VRHQYVGFLATLIAGGAAMAGDQVRLEEVGKPLTCGVATSVVRTRVERQPPIRRDSDHDATRTIPASPVRD